MWVEGREASAVRLLRPSMFYASLGTDGRWWVRLSGRCCAPSWHASACDKVPSRPLRLGTARFLRTRLEGWRCVHPRAMSFMTPARAARSLQRALAVCNLCIYLSLIPRARIDVVVATAYTSAQPTQERRGRPLALSRRTNPRG